jgi:universal stress protein A
MQVYRKILVTIDFSSVDRVALDHVAKLALLSKSEVCLLHVIHAHTLDQSRVLLESAEKALAGYSEELKNRGIDVSVLIRSGEPEDEIVSEIKSDGYDLMVMATHGHSLLSSLVLGSVSKSIKGRVRIPILIL